MNARRITAEQLRAGRAMVRMGQQRLSELSGVSVPSIKRLEGGAGALRASHETVISLIEALEAAGVIFTNGEEPGVKLSRNAPIFPEDLPTRRKAIDVPKVKKRFEPTALAL